VAGKDGVIRKKIADLTPDDLNANKGTERGDYQLTQSLEKYGAGRSILIDKNGKILAGNKTAAKFGELGLDDVVVIQTDGRQLVAVQRTDIDLDTPQGRELAIADNRTGELNLNWDSDVISQMADSGVDLDQFWSPDELDDLLGNLQDSGSSDEESNPYTKKIEAPIYVPEGEKPDIKELYDMAKTSELIQEINQAEISKDEKKFLIEAAKRHTVFDYKKIANYYAHSPKHVQELMERSALVIIDFGKAIENGYVNLKEEIIAAYLKDHSDDE
jgi:hypothetical protein